ncbi:MAG: ABC transporter ATP-binding protein [Hyphomonadaceae bacterium]|nr:ABC transporter ATP-binding protein [Hyphomonadaceae bacterium]
MAELRLDHVHVAIEGRVALRNASLRASPGELVAVLGANGAGKSTLLRAALGLAPRVSGAVWLDGEDPVRMSAQARARKAAYLPQTRAHAWPLRVRDAVALGRFAYGANIARLGANDAAAVDRALAACGLTDFAARRTDSLSGGETARVHVARALASEAPLLLADEPVAALDPRHAWLVMEAVAAFVRGGGAALVVLHDASLAARFAHRIVMMKQGRIIADGAPADVLTPALLAETYGVAARLAMLDGAPAIAVSGPT